MADTFFGIPNYTPYGGPRQGQNAGSAMTPVKPGFLGLRQGASPSGGYPQGYYPPNSGSHQNYYGPPVGGYSQAMQSLSGGGTGQSADGSMSAQGGGFLGLSHGVPGPGGYQPGAYGPGSGSHQNYYGGASGSMNSSGPQVLPRSQSSGQSSYTAAQIGGVK